jgi:hypothetical protein
MGDVCAKRLGFEPMLVMAGLAPAIHVFLAAHVKAWMPGTRPGMTREELFQRNASHSAVLA